MQAVGCRMHIHVCAEETAPPPSGKHSRTVSVLRSGGDQILPANALCYLSCLGSAAFLGVTIPNAWECPCSPLHPHNSVCLLAKLPIKSSAQCLITHTTKPKGSLGFHPLQSFLYMGESGGKAEGASSHPHQVIYSWKRPRLEHGSGTALAAGGSLGAVICTSKNKLIVIFHLHKGKGREVGREGGRRPGMQKECAAKSFWEGRAKVPAHSLLPWGSSCLSGWWRS